MDTKIELEGRNARLRLSGRFDIGTHAVFRNAYVETLHRPEVEKLILDLSEVGYIDSSALGMLLLLRERISAAGKTMEIVNCTPSVREVFSIANFFQLFTIR